MNKCALLLLSLASPSIITMEPDNTDRLWSLVKNGKKNQVTNNRIRELLATRTIDFARQKSNNTLLTWAIKESDATLCTLLIDYKAPVNAQNAWKITPLIAACERGNELICSHLLNNGATIQGANEFEALLSRRPYSGQPNYSIIEQLLQYGADPLVRLSYENHRRTLLLAVAVSTRGTTLSSSVNRVVQTILTCIINKNRHNAQTFMRCLCHLGNTSTNASIKEGARLLSRQGSTLLKPYVLRILFEESRSILVEELNQKDKSAAIYEPGMPADFAKPKKPVSYLPISILNPDNVENTMKELWRK